LLASELPGELGDDIRHLLLDLLHSHCENLRQDDLLRDWHYLGGYLLDYRLVQR